jgi:hypothetical protein
MKRDLTWKDMLAVVIALVALAGVGMMFNAEAGVWLQNSLSLQHLTAITASPDDIRKTFVQFVLPNMQNYSLALGLVLFGASVAYILLGRENDIETVLDDRDKGV